MTSWWDTPQWHAYERECGEEPGTRAKLLAEAQWQTQVVDLSQPVEKLWTGVRHSYRSLIHRAENDTANAWTTFAGGWMRTCDCVCREIHSSASGRVTRSRETWEMMDRWVRDGYGLLRVVSRHVHTGPDERPGSWRMDPFGYVYFIRHGDWAYYASAASLERSVNHALVWSSMMALKERGVRACELGWQGHASDDKGKAIEFFKRGFGGAPISLTG